MDFSGCPECKGVQGSIERNNSDINKLFELHRENSQKINNLLVKITIIVSVISGIAQGITIAVMIFK